MQKTFDLVDHNKLWKILKEMGVLDHLTYLLTCIQVSQGEDQVVWYSHLFQNFPQFVVIHTAKGFGIVNKAKIYVFL